MRSRTLLASVLFLLGAGLLRTAAQEKKVRPDGDAPAARLVRLDLLRRPAVSDVRVRRNIFLLGREAGEEFLSAVAPPSGRRSRSEPAAGPDPKSDLAEPEVRYLGYVTSSRKTIGLIYAGGQALAVSEGDAVQGGFVVRAIRPQSLDLETPEGRILTVSIEGERR